MNYARFVLEISTKKIFFSGKIQWKNIISGKNSTNIQKKISNGKCAENGNIFNENFEKNII